MAKKSVLIIDDEEHGRVLVKHYLQAYPDYFVAGEAQNGLEAIKMIDSIEPDLIFLDIRMPGADGFEVVQRIAHLPKIIFTTAYDSYAIQAFEANALDYLLKPYTLDRFQQTMSKIATFLTPQGTSLLSLNSGLATRILVEHKKRFKNLSTGDIHYLKADGDYTEIHTADQTYLSNFGISQLAQRFDPKLFVRIHRSVVVNISHVREMYRDIGKTFLVMENNTEFNVGRNYLANIKELTV